MSAATCQYGEQRLWVIKTSGRKKHRRALLFKKWKMILLMPMSLANGPASDSWVSYCPFKNLSLIIVGCSKWVPSGFPESYQSEGEVGGPAPILFQQGSSTVLPIGCSRMNFLCLLWLQVR